jgi:hypothetical protein
MWANLETCCSVGRVAEVEVMLWCVEWQAVGDVSKILLTSKSGYLSFYMLCPFLFISLLYLLIPDSRFLLENPTSSQLPKIFFAFNANLRCTTLLTTDFHLFLSWARSIQSEHTPLPLKIHFNIILYEISRHPSITYVQPKISPGSKSH